VRDTGESDERFLPTVLGAFGRAVGTRPRMWLLVITLLAGMVCAVTVAAAAPPAERTFVTISAPTQSLMSVTVPFFGILLMSDLRRVRREARLVPTLVAALAVAVVVAAFGILVCVVVTAAAPSAGALGRWHHVGTIAVGSVLVQVIAQLVGTGLGLLIRSAVVAFIASIVLPLGLWVVLGATQSLRPAQAWLTPYATAQNLLSGQVSPVNWAQWLVVLLVWGVGLNAAGVTIVRQRHRDQAVRPGKG
jgi:hypothetical protein